MTVLILILGMLYGNRPVGVIIAAGPSVLADVIVWAVIALGIYELSRIAAVAGLCIYLLGLFDIWTTVARRNPVVALLITLMFINSVRATFAYHTLQDPVAASDAQVRSLFHKAVKAEVSGDLHSARRLFDQIVNEYSSSALAEDARSCIAALDKRVAQF